LDLRFELSRKRPTPSKVRIKKTQSHKVYRVLSFLSSRRNWDTPPPHLEASVFPLFCFSHSLTGEVVGGSQLRGRDRHCDTLYLYTYVVHNHNPSIIYLLLLNLSVKCAAAVVADPGGQEDRKRMHRFHLQLLFIQRMWDLYVALYTLTLMHNYLYKDGGLSCMRQRLLLDMQVDRGLSCMQQRNSRQYLLA
jgi:hypothetical protein